MVCHQIDIVVVEMFLVVERQDLTRPRSNRHYCLTLRVRSHDRRNELTTIWDFKQVWKRVLFTWRFISALFQNDAIFWWTCVKYYWRHICLRILLLFSVDWKRARWQSAVKEIKQHHIFDIKQGFQILWIKKSLKV